MTGAFSECSGSYTWHTSSGYPAWGSILTCSGTCLVGLSSQYTSNVHSTHGPCECSLRACNVRLWHHFAHHRPAFAKFLQQLRNQNCAETLFIVCMWPSRGIAKSQLVCHGTTTKSSIAVASLACHDLHGLHRCIGHLAVAAP